MCVRLRSFASKYPAMTETIAYVERKLNEECSQQASYYDFQQTYTIYMHTFV